MPRRFIALGALATVVAAGAAAAGAWLALGDSGGTHQPTQSEYLGRVSSICRRYGRQLARIGAPSDIAAYGDVVSTVGRVLPLLREQSAAMQAVQPPAALQPRLDRLFVLSRRSIAHLESARAAARRRDAGGVARGLASFSALRDRSHALAVAIGIDCTTN